MKLSELANYLMNRNGQFVLGPIQSVGLNITALWDIIEPELFQFENFVPLTKKFNINIPSAFNYDFTYDVNNIGFSALNPETITQSESLIATGSQTFTIQLPNGNVVPQTVFININSVSAGYDRATGNLQFTGGFSSQYSGTVNYLTGLVTIIVTGIGSPVTISVQVNANYNTYGTPPLFLSEVTPVGTLSIISVVSYWMSPLTKDYYSSDRIVEPRRFLWEYRNPMLYYTEVGQFSITAHYLNQRIFTYDTNGVLQDVEIVGIEANPYFYTLRRLLSGVFLQTLGRSRRAFTLTDLPIATDANTLVEEGLQQYEAARKELESSHNWWDAVRP